MGWRLCKTHFGARDEFHLAATAQNLRKLAKLTPVPVTASAT